MARDDEIRKVAEDVRALARSLANDVRDSVAQSRNAGQTAGQAVKDSLRDVADQVGRDLRSGLARSGHNRHRRGYYPGYGWWCRPPWAPQPPSPGAPASPPGAPPGGDFQGPPWAGRPYRGPHHGRSRSPLPPVKRRWDATTVLGLLAVLFGVAWLLGALGATHVSVEGVVALGLMLLGAALVVTGRTDWSLSRRSWPVWLGAGLIVVLIATSTTFGIAGALDHLSFGNQSPTVTELKGQTVYGGFGNLTVKVPDGAAGTLKVEGIAGNSTLQLPADAYVTVQSHVTAGQICINGQDVGDGVGAQHTQVIGHGFGPPPVTIDVHQMFGQIIVASPGFHGCSHR